MKRTSVVILCMVITSALWAGAPQGLNYQAVARNANGVALQNQSVNVRLTIHDTTAGGTIVYQETDPVTTNAFGLFNVVIGQGYVVSGNFTSILWGSAPKFLQVELDPTGGTSFTDMGTTQMQSVPYALYAGNIPLIGFRAFGAKDTTLPSGGEVYRVYGHMDFNDGSGVYDSTTGIYTVGASGLYHFAANEDVGFAIGTPTGYVTIVIVKNNSYVAESDYLPGNGNYVSLQTWADIKVATGDRLWVEIVNNSNLSIGEYISDSYNNFTGYKIY